MEQIKVVDDKGMVVISSDDVELVPVDCVPDANGDHRDIGDFMEGRSRLHGPGVVVRSPVRQNDDVFGDARAGTVVLCKTGIILVDWLIIDCLIR